MLIESMLATTPLITAMTMGFAVVMQIIAVVAKIVVLRIALRDADPKDHPSIIKAVGSLFPEGSLFRRRGGRQ